MPWHWQEGTEMESKRVGLSVLGQRPETSPAPEPVFTPEMSLEQRIQAVLETIYDPELPVNIYDLGLIYKLDITPTGEVAIDMTLTAPNCPVAGQIVADVQRKVAAVPGVSRCTVNLVWSPPWDKSRMSEAAALALGFD
jgi:FeS assembly SUF system protein